MATFTSVDLLSSVSSEAIKCPSRKRAEAAQGRKIRLMPEGGDSSEQKVSASAHRTEVTPSLKCGKETREMTTGNSHAIF